MRRTSIVLAVTALVISATASQLNAWTPTTPDAISVAQLSGASYESGEVVAVDADGNIVTAGVLEGVVDMDPGVGVTNVTPVGPSDIFITKLNGLGQLVWAKTIGGNDYPQPKSITIDGTGNIYLAGEFSRTIDFDPSSGVASRTSTSSSRDSFVAKYTSDGNFLWVTTISSDGSDSIRSVATDSSGNVYLAGSYAGNSASSPLLVGGSTTGIGQSVGDDSIFIKLNSTGTLAWAKKIGNNISDSATSINLDSFNNIYVLGSYQLTANFDPNGGTSNLTAAGQFDIYLAKYDSAGSLIWARGFGGASAEESRSLKVDSSGNAYFAGYFQGTADFDPSPNRNDLISQGSDEIFIAKVTPTGDLAWAQRFGSSGSDQANALTLDSQGNVYATGYFAGSADFDPGQGTDTIAVNSYGVFVVKVTANGTYQWAKGFAGASFDEGKAIASIPLGGVAVTGYFDGSSDFDPSQGVATLTASSQSVDAFVLRLDSNGSAAIDVIAPTVTWTSPNSPSSSRTLTFTATFSEPVSGIAASDFTNTGTATGCVFAPSASSTNRNITVLVTCTSDGTVIPQLAANSVLDSAFNTGPTSASSATSVTITTTSNQTTSDVAPTSPTTSPTTTVAPSTTVATTPTAVAKVRKTELPSTGSSPASLALASLFSVVLGVAVTRRRTSVQK